MAEAKRRQYGSGSIYQRKDGKWVGRIEAGWSTNGSRRRIAVVAANEPACKAAVKARLKKLDDEGAPLPGTTTKATVKSWSDIWLTRTVTTKRPKSWATDQSHIRKWVVPGIGHKRLDQLTPGDIRTVTDALRKAGRSTSTARRVQQVTNKMLKDAVLEGHSIPQRVFMVDMPVTAINDRGDIPILDALAILAAASTQLDGSRWAVGLLQGLRQAEALGLTWDRVDLDNGLLDISLQLQAIPYRHGCQATCKRRFAGDCPQRARRIPDGYRIRPLDGALCLVIPKTQSGQRIVPMVPWMVTALRRWKTLTPASPHNLVWPRPDGRPQRPDLDADAWYAIQNVAQVACVEGTEGRHYGLHEMRHTCGTLLQKSGVDDRTITAILGHASIIASTAYIHVDQTATRAAMAEVAARLQLV